MIEIRSASDNLKKLKDKMQEYIENGCRLGWLIDRKNEQVFIYRANGEISVVDSFAYKLTGEDVLPGFEVVLADLGSLVLPNCVDFSMSFEQHDLYAGPIGWHTFDNVFT